MYTQCHASHFLGGALSAALLGCFRGFCPPAFGAPFEFKPFLSFRACKSSRTVMREVPSLSTGVTLLLLLFIMVCNMGCLNMGWEQGSSGKGQWGKAPLHLHNHSGQSPHLPLHLLNCCHPHHQGS